MNVLKAIIERLNQKLDASNLFPSIYGIASPDPNNAKSFLAYDGNGQNLLTADYDKTDGTCFWTLRSAVSVRKADAVQVVACQDMYITTFPLRAYTIVKKTALPCDSNATEGYVMDMFWKYVQGKDTALRSNIGVTDIYFRPVSVSPNTPDLPKQFEYVTLYFDLDVEVTAQLIEGCYDECGVNPIPLPDGSCPPINRVVSVTGLDTDNTDPSRPIVKISVDGTTIIGEGTPANPLTAIGGGGGGGALIALPFTTDHLSATGNAYAVGNIVWYNGNVYRCIAANDSILPTNTSYWVNLGAGFPTVQQPSDWNSSSGNNQILNKPTIPAAQVNSDWNAVSGVAEILNKPTIPAAQSLQEVTDVGNTTDNDIQFDAGVGILLNNTSRLREGTIDAGLGGTKGIAQICAVGYELKWEAGRLYVMDGNGIFIRWSLYNFNITPTVNDDNTKGYINGSRWSLDDGTVYLCSDGTTGAAVWTLQTVGGVTDVTATAPLSSTSGATPDISISQADSTTDGYLSSTDWNTFDSKGNGTVTSVNSGININVDNTDPDNPIINSLSDRYKTTSTTSNSVSNGSKSFTVDLNLSYIPLQEILVVHNPANHMHGEVTSYNSATGALVVDIKNHTGSGTYTSWVLNLDGTPVDALTGSGTANEIAYFTAARVLASLPTATYPSLTELSYVKGVTSAIQTQINGKFTTPSGTTSQYVRGDGSLATFPTSPTIYKSTTDQTAVTGVTTNTKVVGVLIPANTITTGAIVEIKARAGKTGSVGLMTLRVYANTADSIVSPAPTLLTTSTTPAPSSTFMSINRIAVVKSSINTQTAQATVNIISEFIGGTASLTNSNIDWTVAQYIIFAIQNSSALDSTVLSYYEIEIK